MLTLAIIGLCCWFLPVPARAQLSPGELAAPHEALEGLTNCTKCHEFGKGPSAEKCLACHTAVRDKIQSEKGYHFRKVTVEKQACFACHSDHSGRDFELTHWDDGMKRFDHQQTGYTLEGKHASIECRDCHKPDFQQTAFLQKHQEVNFAKTMLGLTDNCLSCHRDEHRGQLGKDCKQCHATDHWTPARGFDHAKSAFVLLGKHNTLQCDKCHKPLATQVVFAPSGTPDSVFTQFKGLKFANCASCHKDPHAGKLGNDCLKCHNNNAWSPASGFDHSTTKFPLTGKHKNVLCEKCHKNVGKNVAAGTGARKARGKSKDAFAAYKGLEFGTCESCHKDVHNKKFGADCVGCHQTTGWKKIRQGSFDHSKTDFPLIGKHTGVACEKCHKDGIAKAKNMKSEHCADCHTDEHNGQFADRSDNGVCESCHNEFGFAPSLFTVERHNKEGAFHLTGAHLAQPCPICHVSEKKKGRRKKVMKFRFAGKDCMTCHKDIHLGQFVSSAPKKECTDCHRTDSWHNLLFDHNRDAAYKLEGAHATTACKNCHKTEKKHGARFARYRPLDSACENCHSMKTLELLGKK